MKNFDLKNISNESEENTQTAREERYLEFSLGRECYAVYLLSVKEVIPIPSTTPLPNSPSHFVGIMNLRGQIISIVDLRKKLKIKPLAEEELEEAVVIIELQGVSIGLIVDSINKVMNLHFDEITEVPDVESQINGKYIQGVCQGKDNLTIMLDLERILNIDEIKKHQSQAA